MHPRHLPLALTTLLLTAPLVRAQVEAMPEVSHELSIDSEWIDNPGKDRRAVFHKVVRVKGADWLRLQFGATNLPAGSYLLLTSLRDKAELKLDALTLRAYGYGSCYLNGDAVRVELVAGPGTKANRVLVASAWVGGVRAPVAETICGSTDDRKQSYDKRQGRLSNGCTGWLFGTDVFATAGHCTSSSGSRFLEFNVPNSTSSGSIVRAHPNDQYPMILSTLSRLSSGVGSDWSVARVSKNANTGKTPGEVQGSWYSLGTVPTSTSGQNIRITGYGSTSPANYLYLVQKTHVGPLYSLASTAIYYRTDTTGGNSGSPILHENTGKVVGIHTHGGCSSSGSSSANVGTRIDRSDLQAAIKNLAGTFKPGKLETFGTGCKGSLGAPALSWSGSPNIGSSLSIVVANVPTAAYGLMVFGRSNTLSGTVKLPFDLGVIGMKGCSQLVSLDVIVAQPALPIAPFAQMSLTIPNDSTLIDQVFFVQYAAEDKKANDAGIVVSNGGKLTIGG